MIAIFFTVSTLAQDCSLIDNTRITKTASGYTCQRWDRNEPHETNIRPKRANHNFCRNPDGGPTGPWCYTNDPKKRWDYCTIDDTCPCNWHCLLPGDRGLNYNGTVSTTKSGLECEWWNRKIPRIKRRPLYTNHNYCRNAEGASKRGPWCYVSKRLVTLLYKTTSVE